MAEYGYNGVQIVEPNEAILFNIVVVPGNASIMHRQGSGLVTLRGLTCQRQRRARFEVEFGGNIGVPTGETPGPISLAIAINGEAVPLTSMDAVPAAVDEYFNVSRTTTIDVPAGCCAQVSVINTSTIPIAVKDPTIDPERRA